MIRIGSLFSGIGGFELGLERAIPKSKTIWQVEQNKFCQTILRKHWPDAKIYDDVRDITKDNVSPVDILCGGFPCQDISVAGKQGGIHAEKSGLWWEMLRIISDLSKGRKKPIVVMENVPNIVRLGGLDVLGSLASIGYNAEWTIISARMFGAPHLRKRWFCVCYPADSDGFGRMEHKRQQEKIQSRRDERLQRKESQKSNVSEFIYSDSNAADSDGSCFKKQSEHSKSTHGKTRERPKHYFRSDRGIQNAWKKGTIESPLCSLDDGIPDRLARLRALGNAIVPQCSEWIGDQIVRSGLLEEI